MSVPTIEFEANPLGGPKTAEVPDGGALLDICDATYAPVPFSCRSATCGTCHIEVLEGADLLVSPDATELELLDLLRGPANSRLACQAVIKPGPGRVRLRPILP
jgi:ferredoxin